ncbi:MAG: PepSY domain-containing protein [Cyanobacteria bacterium RI_101]|nr:PepSY domain-containing protein [Cyanobacteria bacterium RI_101]
MANLNVRKIHRKIAPILFIPLLLSALTGVAYRLGRTYFGVSDELGESILSIHEGKFLGKPLVPFYILLLGLGLVAMIATALLMFKQRRQNYFKSLSSGRVNLRSVHGLFALIFFLPLFISAVTGVMFRISRAWLGLSEEQAEIFMEIHQGSYLGSSLRVVYVLLIGLGLLGILITGIQMTGIFPKRTPGA